ncbi:MAG: protein TolQ [Desulfohalobiaceae bacterium]|nr:protein TolQ [Desulfohalobiaceae bacterium]
MELAGKGGAVAMFLGATPVVKSVLLILLVMSVISWAIILYKVFLLNRVKKSISKEMETFKRAKDMGTGLRRLKEEQRSTLYNIGVQAVTEIKSLEKSGLKPASRVKVSADNVRRVLRQAVSREMDSLAYALSFLATCANSAPYIGLFGTVWGIMHSFQSIGLQQSAALASVAPGIAEALIATALGLAVAIPASIAYNSFLGQLNAIENELVNYAGAFLNRAQREIPWMSASRESQETISE